MFRSNGFVYQHFTNIGRVLQLFDGRFTIDETHITLLAVREIRRCGMGYFRLENAIIHVVDYRKRSGRPQSAQCAEFINKANVQIA